MSLPRSALRLLGALILLGIACQGGGSHGEVGQPSREVDSRLTGGLPHDSAHPLSPGKTNDAFLLSNTNAPTRAPSSSSAPTPSSSSSPSEEGSGSGSWAAVGVAVAVLLGSGVAGAVRLNQVVNRKRYSHLDGSLEGESESRLVGLEMHSPKAAGGGSPEGKRAELGDDDEAGDGRDSGSRVALTKQQTGFDPSDSLGAAAEEEYDDNDEEVDPDFTVWSRENIALFASYSAVGLCDGLIGGTVQSFCFYSWPDEDNNTCSVAGSVVRMAWSIKIFIAFFSEAYRPCGLRRKPYIVGGWALAIGVLVIIALSVESLSFYEYALLAALFEFFMMFAEVSADGYTVELSRVEPLERRGRILANGQMCRFTMNMVAGIVQCTLLNGPSTNAEGQGFAWGLTIAQMYWMLVVVVTPLLAVPFFFFRERPPPRGGHVQVTMGQQLRMVWEVLHNVAAVFIMLWSLGSMVVAGLSNRVSIVMQGSIIQMSQLQYGVDNITTYLALCAGIALFKRYLLNYNWRITQVWTTCLVATLNLLWLVAIYGLSRDPWFTICIDGTENFIQGITQVMISMAVLEIAPKNLEATSYELLISVSNSFLTLNVVLSTQLMGAFRLSELDATNDDSDANERMAQYTVLVSAINVFGVCLCIWLFPRDRKQCAEWKAWGGRRTWVAAVALSFAALTLAYSLTTSILGTLESTSCLEFVGGGGC